MNLFFFQKLILIKPVLAGIVLLFLLAPGGRAENVDNCSLLEDDAERLQCYDKHEMQASDVPVLDQRHKLTESLQDNPFSITPFRPNYLLPISFNFSPNREIFEQFIEPNSSMDKLEVKFQVSFEVDVLRHQ